LPAGSYPISPAPHGTDAHAVRPRRRAASRQQLTADWFFPLVDTAGNYARDTVTDTALRRRWSDQVGQVPGGATAGSNSTARRPLYRPGAQSAPGHRSSQRESTGHTADRSGERAAALSLRTDSSPPSDEKRRPGRAVPGRGGTADLGTGSHRDRKSTRLN